jgi:hypothetical protein
MWHRYHSAGDHIFGPPLLSRPCFGRINPPLPPAPRGAARRRDRATEPAEPAEGPSHAGRPSRGDGGSPDRRRGVPGARIRSRHLRAGASESARRSANSRVPTANTKAKRPAGRPGARRRPPTDVYRHKLNSERFTCKPVSRGPRHTPRTSHHAPEPGSSAFAGYADRRQALGRSSFSTMTYSLIFALWMSVGPGAGFSMPAF